MQSNFELADSHNSFAFCDAQMNEKLNYLEMLKNNVGEEMAEMMSDEITKVMDEQRAIELEYARLVEQRDQLKGITNKHRLEETKTEILVSNYESLQNRLQFQFNRKLNQLS